MKYSFSSVRYNFMDLIVWQRPNSTRWTRLQQPCWKSRTAAEWTCPVRIKSPTITPSSGTSARKEATGWSSSPLSITSSGPSRLTLQATSPLTGMERSGLDWSCWSRGARRTRESITVQPECTVMKNQRTLLQKPWSYHKRGKTPPSFLLTCWVSRGGRRDFDQSYSEFLHSEMVTVCSTPTLMIGPLLLTNQTFHKTRWDKKYKYPALGGVL